VEDISKVFEIKAAPKSSTFHGRDVFAPIAAKLACGESPKEFGDESGGITSIIGKPKVKDGAIMGEVIYTDAFGNIITNITDTGGLKYGSTMTVEISGKTKNARFVQSYGFANEGELICLIGSSGFLEVAVNQGDAGKLLDVKSGGKLVIK
ncbi:MAG: SAM-dependent chlorinase/fluorinase, partial [Candidatus Hydrothermarchaeaceae archaeon]